MAATSRSERLPWGSIIIAAGGVLWHSHDQDRLAVVRRNRYGGDWTLPKGKVQRDESWEDAAQREVQEETGYTASLGEFAGVVWHKVNGVPKVTFYWHMAAQSGHFTANDETIEVQWLTLPEAVQQLSYEAERHLLLQAGIRDTQPAGNMPHEPEKL